MLSSYVRLVLIVMYVRLVKCWYAVIVMYVRLVNCWYAGSYAGCSASVRKRDLEVNRRLGECSPGIERRGSMHVHASCLFNPARLTHQSRE